MRIIHMYMENILRTFVNVAERGSIHRNNESKAENFSLLPTGVKYFSGIPEGNEFVKLHMEF